MNVQKDVQNMTNNAIQRINPQNVLQNTARNQIAAQKSFLEVLDETRSKELSFSKHASARINSREINLTGEQLRRIEEGVDKARGKGITDSLVLVDEYALVVNTRSKTVITAMEANQKNDGIFTNIDGAVIV